MKTIEVDEELYRYIASHTHDIGESASDILRRMLNMNGHQAPLSGMLKESVEPTISGENATARVELLVASGELTAQKKVVNRFMKVLSTLYLLDAQRFTAATESLHGRTRRYFAYDQQTLLQHGTHTKPKHIPDTPYWVITNTNSSRKRNMIEHIMGAMHFPDELIEKVSSAI